MRCAIAVLSMLIGFGAAEAQTPYVARVEIVKAGIMRADTKPKPIIDKSISTGTRVDYPDDPRVVAKTKDIAINGKTIFGIEAKLSGTPPGTQAQIKVVWLYPEPGIKAPGAATGKLRDEYATSQDLGTTSSYYWTADEGYTHVPGKWTIELWQGDRRLARQDFTMLK